MESLLQDLRYAVRTLRASPGFTLMAMLTLALGIGANSAIFSVVNAVLLRPLPYAHPERLVRVWPESMVPQAGFVEMRDRTRSFEHLGGVGSEGDMVLTGQGTPERLRGVPVTGSVFPLLGVEAVAGRTFLPEEERAGGGRVVVLSHGLWQQRFGGDRAVVGRTITLDGFPHTVVGVMGAGFHFPSREAQVWTPVVLDAGNPGAYWNPAGLFLFGRLHEGATVEGALAEVRSVIPRIREAFPWPMPTEWGAGAGVVPLHEQVVGGVRTPLLLLLGAVGLVLLIACANVANLLLARGMARRREIATRVALGAARGRLARQLLTESLVLALLGGAAGLLLATAGGRMLVRLLPADMPRAEEIGTDASVLGFTLLLALLTGVAFGLFPALWGSRADLQASLKDGVKGTGGAGNRVSRALVAIEVALAVVLVISAGLLVRSVSLLQQVDPGFRAGGVVTARLTPAGERYQDPERVRAFYRDLLARVQALPGVETASVTNQLPLDGGFASFPFEVEGQPLAPGATPPVGGSWLVSPGYLQAMGVPLVRGRGIEEADQAGAPDVALVNEKMASQYWPGQDAVGKRFKPVWWQDRWLTVVGVVGNVRHEGLASVERPEFYRPFTQEPTAAMMLVVRSRAADPAGLVAAVRTAVADTDPDVPVSDVRMMEQVVGASLARPRFVMLLLAVFAGVALVLGAVGIYGVMAYAVTQRRHEIGIRMALGAGPVSVQRMVVKGGLTLAVLGLLAGIAAAFATTRLLASQLFGVGPADPLTFVGVALAVMAVAFVATWVPARRATRVDPMVALRTE